MIHADFQVVETNLHFEKRTILRTPIYALLGSEKCRYDAIENWNKFTTGGLQYEIFEGNHFLFMIIHTN